MTGDQAFGTGMHLLIVEDEPTLRSLLGIYFLQHTGYQVTIVADGHAALHILKTRQPLPDLVLTDVSLPGMDGYQLLQNIRTLYGSLPVIFLTGMSPEESKDTLVQPDAIVLKPVKLADLQHTVEEVLHHK